MAAIIGEAAELGLMLPKSFAQLYEDLRHFVVAENTVGEPRVLGVCGLSIIWGDLAEVVSLAVLPETRGQGLGAQLVLAVLEDAKKLGIRRVMSLTYQQRFFERLGFSVVDRMKLPHKVWADCVRCPKHDACDEIAMIHVLEEVPPAKSPVPPDASVLPPELGGFQAPTVEGQSLT